MSPRTSKLAARLAPAIVVGLVAVAAAEAPAPGGELSAAGRTAAALVERGEIDAAIAALEASPDAGRTDVDRSLLGALYYEAGRHADAWAVLEPLSRREDADAAVLYHAGRTALALGRRGVAAGLFQRSARLAPQSPATRELGLLAGQMGRLEEAYALLRPWAVRHADDVVAVRAAAAAALQLDLVRDAELLLRALPPDEPAHRLLHGQLELLTGRPQEAAARLAPLLEMELGELDVDLRRLVADAYVQLGRSAEAVPLVAPCAAAEPRCALLLAEAAYRGGDVARAVAALEPHARTALADADAYPAALRGRLVQTYGRMLVAAARYGDALPALELASELLPDEPLSWKSLGDALAASGERERAVAALERFRAASQAADERRRQLDAARQDPARAALAEARQFLAAGRNDAALAVVRRERALAPESLFARLAEIQVLIALRRLDEALAAAAAAVEAFPADADARYTRGAVHLARGERAASEADFVAALELAPGHVPTLHDYSLLLLDAQRADEARRLLERALAIDPDDPVARRRLAELDGATP